MIVHVTKAFDERRDETKGPKTEEGIRDVPIPPSLVPLLRRMRKRADGTERDAKELVVPILDTLTDNRRATNIRFDLRRAGVARPRLFENTATTVGSRNSDRLFPETLTC